jgi:hypothetical protein
MYRKILPGHESQSPGTMMHELSTMSTHKGHYPILEAAPNKAPSNPSSRKEL